MKLFISITLGLFTTTSLIANTTMCYKENHKSMATIEQAKLDGGECASSKSLNDMKSEGWSIDNINIEKTSTGTNYIYILKKDTQKELSSIDEKELEQRIMQRLEDRKKEEINIKKQKVKARMSKNGKEIYINKCQSCHGEKAEKKAYGTSRPLINLAYEDMRISIRDYTVGEYDRGKAFVMRPYAAFLTTKRIKDVYSYIQTLKPKEESSKEKKEEESSN